MTYRILVGIPSYNEEDSIAFVVKQLDKGIQKFYNPNECLIINLDSDSKDKTKDAFLKTQTKTSKKYINAGSQPRGKGKNLLRLFQLSRELNAEYVVTVDADIKTVNPNWVFSILNPLIEEGFDYCVPIYSRNRFEGNITNNFAYPLVYSIYGVEVRQPIGGDFGISKRLCDYLLKQPIHETTLKYGIDIFMTCYAIGGGFNITEVYLGRKFHRPSFYHMIPTFQNVFETGVYVTRLYNLNKHKPSLGRFRTYKQARGGIDKLKLYPHKAEVPNLLQECSQKFFSLQGSYKNYLGSLLKPITGVIKSGSPSFSTELWTSTLAAFLKACYKEDFKKEELSFISELITPIYLWRAASFWEEVESATPKDAENKIRTQARLLRSKVG